MDLEQAKAAAAYRRPVLARIPISGGASDYTLCRRVAAVCYVVPENGGGFWSAECIEKASGVVYRVRVEDIKEV